MIHQIDLDRKIGITVDPLRSVTDEDRESLSALNSRIDADRFQSRIDYADKTKNFIPESLADIAAQGLALVMIDDENGVAVPADNIKKAKNLTDEDRARFENSTGKPMRADYLARIETRAGAVLATLRADMVIKRMSQPYRNSAAQEAAATAAEPSEDADPAAYKSAAEAYDIK